MALQCAGAAPLQTELERMLEHIAREQEQAGTFSATSSEVWITKERFVELFKVCLANPRESRERLAIAFAQVFDKRGTGYVEPQEVLDAARQLGEPISRSELTGLLKMVQLESNAPGAHPSAARAALLDFDPLFAR
jgi:Ca2+-binding EF-hand superfamily protein|tara:strand:- start:15 stop:422 length:408 start_codon:yes stop_codon:yes gene_type:complete